MLPEFSSIQYVIHSVLLWYKCSGQQIPMMQSYKIVWQLTGMFFPQNVILMSIYSRSDEKNPLSSIFQHLCSIEFLYAINTAPSGLVFRNNQQLFRKKRNHNHCNTKNSCRKTLFVIHTTQFRFMSRNSPTELSQNIYSVFPKFIESSVSIH